MKISLFDKLQSITSNNSTFRVNYLVGNNSCDIEFENLTDPDDNFTDLLKDWLYNELLDKLISNDAFADSINVEFSILNNIIIADLILRCSDESFEKNERHSKEEIISKELLEILSKSIKNLNRDQLDFTFEYNHCFKKFELYYYNELVELNLTSKELIKSQILKIIEKWPGVFRGRDALEVNKYFTIDLSDHFNCYDLVHYKFEFEKES